MILIDVFIIVTAVTITVVTWKSFRIQFSAEYSLVYINVIFQNLSECHSPKDDLKIYGIYFVLWSLRTQKVLLQLLSCSIYLIFEYNLK